MKSIIQILLIAVAVVLAVSVPLSDVLAAVLIIAVFGIVANLAGVNLIKLFKL